MNSVRKSLAYSMLSANIVTVLQFASSLALARMLTPAEFGIYSVAAVLVGLAAIFRELGASNYLIQADALTNQMLRAAFALMLISAFLLGTGLLIAAPFLADFYSESQLTPIVRLLALNFFLTPFGAISLTVARREMRFRALMIVSIVGSVASISTSVSLAYLGNGAMSLAWGGVSGTTATVVCALFLRKSDTPWLPSLKGIRPMLAFGSSTVGANFLGSLNMNAPDAIIGRMLDMETVGFFNRARSFSQFVSTALWSSINPVMLPWMSQLKRERQPPQQSFIIVTELVTGVTWPAFATIAILNEPLIFFLFGDQWGKTAELVPYICLSAAVSAIYTAASATYVSQGKPQIDLIAQAINLPIKVIVIVFAAPYGLLALAMAWPISAIAGAVSHQVLLHRYAAISGVATLMSLRKSAAVTIMVSAVVGLTNTLCNAWSFPTFFHLAFSGFSAALMLLCSAWLVRHPLFTESLRLFRRKVPGSFKN